MPDPAVPREIDHRAIDAFLTYGYVPAPLSAYAAVRKLPPGERAHLPTTGAPTSSATGSSTTRASARGYRGGARTRAARADHRSGSQADGRRRPHGRLPVGRDRLVGRGGGDGRERPRPGEDVLDRLRGGAPERAPAGAAAWPRSSAPTTTSCWCGPTRSRSSPRSSATTGSRSPTRRRCRPSTCPVSPANT